MSRGFSPAAFAAFSAVFRPWMRRRIAAVHLSGLPQALPPHLPILLVANHVSWWDGFLLMELARALRPRAPLHTVMLDSELRHSPFLRRIGAVGIDPGSPASVGRATRELERRLRERPDSLISFFPQGRIAPSFGRPLGFRRGVELFARRLAPASILPIGLHLEPMTTPSPHAWVSVGTPVPASGGLSAQALEAAVEAEVDRVLAFLGLHGEDAPRRRPGAATTRLPDPGGEPPLASFRAGR